jgi:hypothetical protein
LGSSLTPLKRGEGFGGRIDYAASATARVRASAPASLSNDRQIGMEPNPIPATHAQRGEGLERSELALDAAVPPVELAEAQRLACESERSRLAFTHFEAGARRRRLARDCELRPAVIDPP